MKPIDEILKNERITNERIGIDGFSSYIKFGGYTASLIVSTGAGWEHASISPLRKVMPSWEDMCTLKDIIWNEDEEVIQIHPAKKEYVNNMPYCLHLWRCTYRDMVLPPSCLVGRKKGQTDIQLMQEVKEAYEMAGEKYTPY